MTHALRWSDIRLGTRLGEGHSGIVVQGELVRDYDSLAAGSIVAVKMYKPWVLREAGQLERIFRELNVGRTVRHPNVVAIIAALLDESNNPALVMKYYPGPTLESVLSERRGQPVPIDEALELLRGIGAGLLALHSRRVIHRDVKPANVILSDGMPIVTDLGVVRSESMPEQTSTGAFLGTIRYAAPEYVLGEPYDERVDLYSLGAIAYELITGHQFMERQQHWARLVAAKISLSEAVGVGKLKTLAERIGLRTTHFCRMILDHTLCKASIRSLDLASFIAAVDQQLWNAEFYFDDGRFGAGTAEFDDVFRTSRRAAELIRSEFDAHELGLLRRAIKDQAWRGVIFQSAITPRMVDGLIAVGAVKSDYRHSPTVRIAPSLVEAIVFNLV